MDYGARLQELGWLDGGAFTRERLSDPAFRRGADLADRLLDLGLLGEEPRVLGAARVGDIVDFNADWDGVVAAAERSVLLAEPGRGPFDRFSGPERFSLTPGNAGPFADLRAHVAVRTDYGYALQFGRRPWAMAVRTIKMLGES
jgi:hypothetical protein